MTIEEILLKNKEVRRSYRLMRVFFSRFSAISGVFQPLHKSNFRIDLSFVFDPSEENRSVKGHTLLKDYFSPGVSPKAAAYVSKNRFSGALKKLRLTLQIDGWRAFWFFLQMRIIYSKIIRKKKLILFKKESFGWTDFNFKDVTGLIVSKNIDLYNFKKNLRIKLFTQNRIKVFFRI